MYEEVRVLTHSSIKITGEKVLYFDPYEVAEEWHDADVIFVTHDHFDHFSPEDIRKVQKEGTLLVLPECMKGQEAKQSVANVRFVNPSETIEVAGLTVQTVAAYNRMKPFHLKGKGYVGYLVTMAGVTYYVAGDTDITPENQQVSCDVALVPAGGKFTMNYKEAAELVNRIEPKLAIPTHYGTVAGSVEDGERFAQLVREGIEVRRFI
ncbi:MAG: MBL fold metallo-hydrolase [Butyrivibrio sp.]|nr:MBL fold metallo-hydrolase [Muribaculum sp.]MCM1553481.1 MBL fold metallo-hydrolase [Butyrivibrio sp.]